MTIDHPLQLIDRNNQFYPNLLAKRLGKDAPADLDGTLSGFFNPFLLPSERAVAQIEGWILGTK